MAGEISDMDSALLAVPAPASGGKRKREPEPERAEPAAATKPALSPKKARKAAEQAAGELGFPFLSVLRPDA